MKIETIIRDDNKYVKVDELIKEYDRLIKETNKSTKYNDMEKYHIITILIYLKDLI